MAPQQYGGAILPAITKRYDEAMNVFDAVLLGLMLVAIGTGFRAGLLRSLATILAYLIAAPITLALSPPVREYLTSQQIIAREWAPFVPFAILLAIGFVLGALMRGAVGSATGGHMMLADRMLGALLGAVRIGLLAVLLVLIFERIIPPGREPDWFLQSKARPYLSVAGAQGLRALPPNIVEYIDRIKREHGL